MWALRIAGRKQNKTDWFLQLNLFVMAGAVVECPWDLLSCPCIAVTAGLTSSAVLLQERRLSIASGTGGAGVGVSSEAQMALED